MLGLVLVRHRTEEIVFSRYKPNMDRSDEIDTRSSPVDEKGKPLDMPPEFLEEGEDEPVYERAQLNQNMWHHYSVR
jgi:hypothetical protein